MSNMVGAASLVNKVGESWSFMKLLKWVTPKADKAQSLDFAVKTLLEMLTYCQINGIPGDNVGDFVKGLTNYKDEALMRVAALICVDGLIPLGPDYLDKAFNALNKGGAAELQGNSTYQAIEQYIPGDSAHKVGVVKQTLQGVQGWMSNFTIQNHLTQDSVLGKVKGFIDVNESKLDYVAAFIDISTNYYEHTGTQTVARSLIERAVNEI